MALWGWANILLSKTSLKDHHSCGPICHLVAIILVFSDQKRPLNSDVPLVNPMGDTSDQIAGSTGVDRTTFLVSDVQDWASVCRHQKEEEEDLFGRRRAHCPGDVLLKVSQAQHPGDHTHFWWLRPGERCKYQLCKCMQLLCNLKKNILHFYKMDATVGRWYVSGSATEDRRGSAWPCLWMRSATVSTTSRARPLWTWPPPPFPARATQLPATPPPRLPHSTCPSSTGPRFWNRPWTPDWLLTWLDRRVQAVSEPHTALPKPLHPKPNSRWKTSLWINQSDWPILSADRGVGTFKVALLPRWIKAVSCSF